MHHPWSWARVLGGLLERGHRESCPCGSSLPPGSTKCPARMVPEQRGGWVKVMSGGRWEEREPQTSCTVLAGGHGSESEPQQEFRALAGTEAGSRQQQLGTDAHRG